MLQCIKIVLDKTDIILKSSRRIRMFTMYTKLNKYKIIFTIYKSFVFAAHNVIIYLR